MESTEQISSTDMADGQDSSMSQIKKDDVNLASQKLKQRKILFWVCLIICGLLYFLFFCLVYHAYCDEDFFENLLEYKHIGTFIIALLIVPSALLWGMLRAAYMSESTQKEKEADSLIKTLGQASPLSDN